MRSEDTPGTRPPGRLLEPFSVAVLLAAVEERSDSTDLGYDVGRGGCPPSIPCHLASPRLPERQRAAIQF